MLEPPSDNLRSLLEFIYGPEIAAELLPRIAALLRKHPMPPRLTIPRGSKLPLTEKDALLITYGDQLRRAGQTPLRTLAGFCQKHLSELVSGVHILPFFPSSSDDGFSVVDYHAVDSALGSWEDVQVLGRSFDLMFDAVFNHVSAQSDWFKGFLQGDLSYRDYFITVEGDLDLKGVVRPRALPLLSQFGTANGPRKVWTTFSSDQIDLNWRNPEVLLRMLDVLLFYAAQGARFIRLDAIAYLWKEIGTSCIHRPQAHALVRLMRVVLDAVAPQVMLITETNVPHAENVSYFGDGIHEAQLVYNFALPPLVLHALLTGDGRALTSWAQAFSVPSEQVTFFNFLASHDGIGLNPARGILSEQQIQGVLVETALAHGGFVSYKDNPDGSRSPYELNISYFDALSDPFDETQLEQIKVDRFLVAQAIMLAMAGMPGIYFHSLVGSRNDRPGAETSGLPRRINRQKLGVAELEAELGDRSTLRARVMAGWQKLLGVRRAWPAFHPTGRQIVCSCDPKVFVVTRVSPDQRDQVVCMHNLSSEAVVLNLEPTAGEGRPLDLLGSRSVLRVDGRRWEVNMGPYDICWIGRTGGRRPV